MGIEVLTTGEVKENDRYIGRLEISEPGFFSDYTGIWEMGSVDEMRQLRKQIDELQTSEIKLRDEVSDLKHDLSAVEAENSRLHDSLNRAESVLIGTLSPTEKLEKIQEILF